MSGKEELPHTRYGKHISSGCVLDHFEWRPDTNKLGEGTYGTVCKALCTWPRTEEMEIGEWYAIKVLRKEKLRDEAAWRAVFHEIEILRRLDSPYCITLLDAFQSNTSVYLVLEYVDGGELFDFIKERGHLSEQDANQITKQMLDALRFLHCDQKIVHRDLKPDNILMVKDTMQIKLIDFGFAKFFGQNQLYPFTPNKNASRDMASLSPGATVPSTPSDLILNTPIGTLKYCAPEILKRLDTHGIQARVTTRIDIQKLDMFAAGVIVYVMLSGVWPFSSKSTQALATQIERGIEFPEDRFGNVSAEAKDFCMWMLHPDRKKRPLSFEALNHKWLRNTVPATPLEVWEKGNQPEAMDPELFDRIRELDKETEEAAKDDAPVVARRPKEDVVLLLPKKAPAKKPSPPISPPPRPPSPRSEEEDAQEED
eukprot:EG_transcript_9986